LSVWVIGAAIGGCCHEARRRLRSTVRPYCGAGAECWGRAGRAGPRATADKGHCSVLYGPGHRPPTYTGPPCFDLHRPPYTAAAVSVGPCRSHRKGQRPRLLRRALSESHKAAPEGVGRRLCVEARSPLGWPSATGQVGALAFDHRVHETLSRRKRTLVHEHARLSSAEERSFGH
jgi:hypothetical protein